MSLEQAIGRAGWLAVFPGWFGATGILAAYEQVFSCSIPLDQYTVCDCQDQIENVVYRKTREVEPPEDRAHSHFLRRLGQ
jgi:hypothetical protein